MGTLPLSSDPLEIHTMTSYRYRPHLRWARNYTFWGLHGLGGFVFILMAAIGYWPLGLGLLALVVGEAWLIRYFLNRFIHVQITTDEQGLNYKNGKGSVQIPYAQIDHIRFPNAKYVGGWIKIQTRSQTIRLTVVLEGIGEFIRELKQGLDRHNSNLHYDENKLFSFFKTSLYSDQSWARLYEVFGRLMGAQVLALIVGTLLASILRPTLPIILKIGMGLFSVFWVVGIYLLSEYRFIKAIEQQTDPTTWDYPERNVRLEATIYRQGAKWGAIAYGLAMPIVTLFIL